MTDRFDIGWRVARSEARRLVTLHMAETLLQAADAQEAFADGHGPDRRDEFRWKREALEAAQASIEAMRRGEMVQGEYAPEHDQESNYG